MWTGFQIHNQNVKKNQGPTQITKLSTSRYSQNRESECREEIGGPHIKNWMPPYTQCECAATSFSLSCPKDEGVWLFK